MGNLYFLRKWSENGREATWSGTPNGLLNALNENIGREKIKAINLSFNGCDKIIVKTVHGLFKLLAIDGCEIIDNLVENRKVNKMLKDNDGEPIIVFGEYKTNRTKDMYIFMDCSVNYTYRCHTNNVEFSQYMPFSRTRKYSLLSVRDKRARLFYQKCKGIFTMGQWLADDLINCVGITSDKVHCVGGGTNVSEKLIDVTSKCGNKFLFVGRDFERKNGPLVVEAFQRLNNKYKGKFELYIAGPLKWPLSIDVPEKVHFLGLKSTEDLSEYYNLCDVFVMPSQFEAYGIVFAEALIYGLPVIARDAFSMRDFVTPGVNGYLMKTNSAQELAGLMETAILNHGMRKRVIDDRDKYIAQYSWKTVADRICKVIEDDGYKI